ncbi:hypothetical protein CGRA01v4_08719 [Colletotrichum graminicola]|nr:hypothetical protein CGRA01v4_08719 [Colletotrichum graminicola]
MNTRTYEYLHMMTGRDETPRRQTKKNGRDMHPRVTPPSRSAREETSRGRVWSDHIKRSPHACSEAIAGKRATVATPPNGWPRQPFQPMPPFLSMVSNIIWPAEQSPQSHVVT